MRRVLSAQPVVAAGTSLRAFQYATWNINAQQQAYTRGDMLSRIVDQGRYIKGNGVSAEATALTGNPTLFAYDADTMFSPEKHNAVQREIEDPMPFARYWDVPSLGDDAKGVADAGRRAYGMFRRGGLTEQWFLLMAKDYPATKPLMQRPGFKAGYLNFFENALAVVEDSEALAAVATEFFVARFENDSMTSPLFWRFSERLMTVIESQVKGKGFMETGAFSDIVMGPHELRNARICVERITKAGLNGLLSQSYSHPSLGNPMTVEVTTFRAAHDAGLW